MSSSSRSESAPSTRVAWFAVNVFWYSGFVALILVMALLTVMLTTDFRVKYVHLPLEVNLIGDTTDMMGPTLAAPGSIPIAGFSDLVVEAEHLPGIAYVLLMPLLLSLGYLYIAYQVRAFLKTVRAGAPFAEDNPGRIRKIGWMLVAAGPVYGLMNYLYGLLYVDRIRIPGATIETPFDVHLFVVLLGLVVLALAHAFRLAATMRRDQELTV